MTLGVFNATIVDGNGNLLPGASVEVRDDQGAIATIYANAGGTTGRLNPFIVDDDAFAQFYVEPGRYTVKASLDAYEITWVVDLQGREIVDVVDDLDAKAFRATDNSAVFDPRWATSTPSYRANKALGFDAAGKPAVIDINFSDTEGATVVEKFLATEGQTTFTLENEVSSRAFRQVFVGGVHQSFGYSFSTIDNTLTFSEGLPAGTTVTVYMSLDRGDFQTFFKNVDAVRSDEQDPDDTIVGEIWVTKTEGFSYEVAAASATDHHLETAGGVKLYETGSRFSSLDRLKDAVARGEVYDVDRAVFAGGEVYRFKDDGNTNIPGLTGWQYTPTTFFVSSNGSDAASGLIGAPKATLAAAVALMRPRDEILLEAGSRFFGRLKDLPDNVKIGRYGSGEDPIIDGSRLIPAAAWIAHPTEAGVWYADVTHEYDTLNDSTPSSNTKYCMWAEWSDKRDVDLVPYWSGANIDANVAYIAAAENVFTCHVQGSAVSDPRLDINTKTYRYYVSPPNGEDPSAGEIDYYYGEHAQVASLSAGNIATDMIWQRSAAKDLSGHNGTLADRLERIRVYGASGHAWVGGAMLVKDCYAECRRAGEDYDGGASGWHMYLGTGADVANIEGCEAVGFGYNYYVHASEPNDSHKKIRIRNCISRDARLYGIFHGDNVTQGTLIDGFRGINDAAGCSVDNGTVIRNSSFHVTGSLIEYYGPTGGTVEIENCVLVSTGAGKLAYNQSANINTDGAHRANFIFRNCTVVGGKLTTSTYWRLCDYEFYDCVLGDILSGRITTTVPWSSITAENTQMQMWYHTLEEIQALSGASGVGSDCIVPAVTQTLTKVASADNLSRPTKASRSVSGTASSTTITASYQDWAEVNGEIPILDYDGAGGTWTARITAVNSTGSGGTIEVSPAPDATFSGKSFQLSNWGKILWPHGDTGITAVFSDDGTQAYFSDVSGISVGTWVRFGGLGRRPDIGVRKITALSGQTATLDTAAEWWRENSDHDALLYEPLGGGAGIPRPEFTVSFEFPLRNQMPGTADIYGPVCDITHVAPASGAFNSYENSASGGRARFTGDTPYLGADGTDRSIGQILHERGEIDYGAHPIGVGDTFTMTAVIYIDEFAPQFASDPFLTGKAELVPGTRVSDLGIGAGVQL